ncbi:hypothetical protein ACIDE9_00145 [Methylophilus sp. 'Pure River']|uniref:hypothetical protein n=1 Tax=Methylophilus sp. 'Pure River' TaxID=3377117 RepID=UPI00398ED453
MKLLMPSATGVEVVRAFVAMYRGKMIQSTSADVIDYPGVLYNVTGSTKDPKAVKGYKGLAWKALLKEYPDFYETSCYVTNPILSKRATSHPGFDVGGHMTPNPSGVVQRGADSYLMPLCKWHNSTRRNGTAFSHSKTKVLKLRGYMEGDSAITFAMRMGNNHAHTLLFLAPGSKKWDFIALSDAVKQGFDRVPLKAILTSPIQEYAIFEKRDDGFYIVSSNISEGGSKD